MTFNYDGIEYRLRKDVRHDTSLTVEASSNDVVVDPFTITDVVKKVYRLQQNVK